MSTANEEFIRVSEAKRRYLGGTVSIRWWYRQIEDGRLPHFRAGTAVVLRIADVDALITELFRDKARGEDNNVTPPAPSAAPAPKRSRKSGLRFFN